MTSRAIREVAEQIMSKFGRGIAGNTVEEAAEALAKAVAKHGDEALPFLSRSGHVGFNALEQAGPKSAQLLKFFSRSGDDAILIAKNPQKLDLFLTYGDEAAEAIIKHPGIAEDLITEYGEVSIKVLNKLSASGAQKFGILSKQGLFKKHPRSKELIEVVETYGERGMNVIWKNKGALLVSAVLVSFLADPDAYINGVKELGKGSIEMIGDKVLGPIVQQLNWTWILGGILLLFFFPHIMRILKKGLYK